MFESDREIVNTLLSESDQFKELYKQHQALDKQVDKVALGNVQLGDIRIAELKKEKLRAKDRMAHMIEEYRRINP